MPEGLRRETVLYGLATVVSGLVLVAYLPFISGLLTPEQAGEAGTLRIISEILTGLLVLGLPMGVMKLWQEPGVSRRSVVGRSLAGAALGALAAGAAVLLLSGWLVGLLRLSGGWTLFNAFMLGLAAALVQIALSFHRAGGRAVYYLRLQASRGVASVALLPLLFAAGYGSIASFLGARWVPALAVAALAAVSAARSARAEGAPARGLYRFCLPLMPSGLALLVLSSADMLMLRRMAPTLDQSGIYEWSSTACMALSPFTLGFGMAWHRHIFAVRGTEGGLASLGRSALVFITALNALAMVLALFSPELAAVVGGAEYEGAARVLPILTGATALYGIYVISQTGPLLEGRTWLIAATTVLGAAANIAFNARLIPRYGAAGAALATLGTNLFMAGSLFWSGRKAFPASLPVLLACMAVPAAMGPLSTTALPVRVAVAIVWTGLSAALSMKLLRSGRKHA